MKNAGYIIAKQDELPDYYKGKYVYQHILIAEQMLGRRLKKGERVHHIDKNKKNNDPNNLLVFASNSDHTRHHNGAQIYKEGDVWKAKITVYKKLCPICGKSFETQTLSELHDRHFCSRRCAQISYSRMNKGDLNDEIELILLDIKEAKGNFTAVAKKYGISANAIVHRLKVRGLPYHSMDYR